MPLRHARPAPVSAGSAAGPRDRLDAADPAERRRAAQALAGQPRAVSRLAARLAVEADRAVLAALLDALVANGSDAALAAVARLLTAEEPGARAAALEAIGRIADARAVALLLPLLDDPAADHRLRVLTALGGRRAPRLVARLAQLMAEDADANVCAAAADLIGRQGDAAARPALLRLKARFRTEPFLQFAIDAALAQLAEG